MTRHRTAARETKWFLVLYTFVVGLIKNCSEVVIALNVSSNSPHRTDFLSRRFSFLTHMDLMKKIYEKYKIGVRPH